jgi:ubiquinone/menaquinone biosynthesis C-methylase UbiE
LVEIARNRGCEVMVCDNLNLPFRDQGFDAIISIGGKAAGSHIHTLPWEKLTWFRPLS